MSAAADEPLPATSPHMFLEGWIRALRRYPSPAQRDELAGYRCTLRYIKRLARDNAALRRRLKKGPNA